MRKVINLYYHLSRALFYDVDSKELITGETAEKMEQRAFKLQPPSVGRIEYKDGVKVDVWGNGKPTLIAGDIIEL